MKQIFFFLLLLSSSAYSQCTWNSFFPFKAGDTKFDIARLKSTNSTIADKDDEYGLRSAVDKINNGYKKYDYLKDSVYINVINLQFNNNICLKSKSNHIQVTLSDDKLHKGTVTLEYDDYDTMKQQYDQLLDLVPEEYSYIKEFERTNKITNEKVGEGVWFTTKSSNEKGEKLNRIGIGYSFNFKSHWDSVKKEFHQSNEIEEYVLEINFTDLRLSKLTNQGY
ncbi:hypothetical protein ACKUSY_05905 [Myroides odoratus]|uniref:Uncharacterized protein n=1 Tax=Myroides odoratus TaxID=256 RepID=A0A378RN37_MYROD|nr:hypothetical protein [Myroides odoratus]QQU04191.1 hypothetical protein I6I89_02570 [Myroides odoratus]STZ28405.1 Uncharacterised protein [Myroides odoratus]